jgi:hypothetical protein
MSLRKVFPQLLDTTGASDGQVLRYVEANSRVEFVTATTGGSSDTVQDNLNRLSANVTANVGLVSDNVDSASSNVTALSTNIDTVSGNVDSYATYANSAFGTVTGFTFAKIAVGTVGNVEANVASDQLTLVAGNNITINADAATDTLTFKAALSNAVNNYFIADGTTNAFTLTQAASSNLDVLVSVEGLIQSPNLHYQVDSTTLTLMNTLPLENGTEVMVRWIPNTAENTVPDTPPSHAQGEVAGFHAGKTLGTNVGGSHITKVLFTSDVSYTDLGELTQNKQRSSAASSQEAGYMGGGHGSPYSDDLATAIEKFLYVSDGDGANIGDLATKMHDHAGTMSSTHGYAVFGYNNSPFSDGNIYTGSQKWPFASDTDASTVSADLGGFERRKAVGVASPSSGYIQGGKGGTPVNTNVDAIESFPFASDTSTSDVGEMTKAVVTTAGANSTEYGYAAGGTIGMVTPTDPIAHSDIEKFPFASNSSSSDIGDLIHGVDYTAGSSSTTHGYVLAGRAASPSGTPNNPTLDTAIQKYSFASDENASDVGEMFSFGKIGGMQT